MNLRRKTLLPAFFTLIAVLLLQSCSDDPTRIDYSTVPPPYDTTNAVSRTVGPDGLIVYTIDEGDGYFEVISRDRIEAFYTGRTTDGKIFESSYANGSTSPSMFNNLTPVTKTVANTPIPPIIEGLRRGFLGMKGGEKRTIVVPPDLGYVDVEEGESGYNLRNDTLIFDVKLASIL